MRFLLASAAAVALVGASSPQPTVTVTLPTALASDASGRLLLFVKPATPENAGADVDVNDRDGRSVSVTARDVASFGSERSVQVDTEKGAFPAGFGGLPPGEYRVQALLDRDGSYNYGGRGPGDLVSTSTTIRLPLSAPQTIALEHVLPPEREQFDVSGLPPVAAQQIAASRPHLHDERIASPALSRFSGSDRSISAWVLTPPGYDPASRRTYPVVYQAGGFGSNHLSDGQQLSHQWHMMETGALPPMIWVALDYGSRTGTTEFADSVNNGPWGKALIDEVIPALEKRYRMDAKPSGRFLTGHSSGGWFALWTIVRHPAFFGGSWATSPDPVDFRDFIGVNLYRPGANMYRDESGRPRPLERNDGKVERTIEEAARLEAVLGENGGQLRAFDWVFSPRNGAAGPSRMFDWTTGEVDPQVATYWREHYDISHYLEGNWPKLRKHLDGKLHVAVGSVDSLYLDGSVRRLEATMRKLGANAQFEYVPGANHAVSQVYARAGDRTARWKEMTAAMYAIARPHQAGANTEYAAAGSRKFRITHLTF